MSNHSRPVWCLHCRAPHDTSTCPTPLIIATPSPYPYWHTHKTPPTYDFTRTHLSIPACSSSTCLPVCFNISYLLANLPACMLACSTITCLPAIVLPSACLPTVVLLGCLLFLPAAFLPACKDRLHMMPAMMRVLAVLNSGQIMTTCRVPVILILHCTH